ncbi:MAG: transglycosylase SLT domain-containing protein [Gemmatimonadales bacterium]|nr:transglycosylase SLT domain-containing protein [Gemmatimonadales bacterium]
MIHTNGKRPITQSIPTMPWPGSALIVCLGLGLLLGIAGCGERIDSSGLIGHSDEPTIPYPVIERDMDEILKSGILRMITFYGSSRYFIHKGGQAGFDFELVSRFAKQHGLTLEVVIPQEEEDLISLLNSGRGDVVCASLNPDEQLEKWVCWTRPTNFVNKVVVLPAHDRRPSTLAGLNGLTLALPDGDPFRGELLRIREDTGAGFFLQSAGKQAHAEELLAMVSRREIQGTVTDDIVARAAVTYLPDLRLGSQLGDQRPTVWLLRRNNPDLKNALDGYLKRHLNVGLNGRTRRSQTYGIIYDRYFENPKTIQGFREAAHRPDKSGKISDYDEMIQQMAEKHGLDWRMVAALIYQESRFFPQARSKAGALGLMQVLPQFAGPQADSLFVPEPNLRAGLRLMESTFNSYAYLDSLDRWCFTLAEYHAGIGHLTDARRIAMDMGRDPNRWNGSLAVALPRLVQKKFYKNTRHGFYGGNQTVQYVKEILNRYRMYTLLVPRYQPEPLEIPDLILPGILNFRLKTLSELRTNQPPPPLE